MSDLHTITQFFDAATLRDFSRDFLFKIELINFGDNSETFGQNDLIYATAASVPSRSIANIPVPYRGLNFNVPGSVTYGSAEGYSIRFYCDASAKIYGKFLRETRRVFQDANPSAVDSVPRGAAGTSGDYRIAGQAAQIVLHQLDKALIPVRQYTLIGASIRDVGSLDYKISDGKGDVMSFDVKIAYHYFVDSEIAGDADSAILFTRLPSDGGGVPNVPPLLRRNE
jgi:hypothetical protein